jgi:hypothetical protein
MSNLTEWQERRQTTLREWDASVHSFNLQR